MNEMAIDDEEDRHQQQPLKIERPDSCETSEDAQSVPMLPTEIIVDILLKLPVESLLRCRSVCKLWCSLISDPHFVKSHLTLSTNDHHKLLYTMGPRIYSCHLDDMLCHNPININASDVDYPFKDPCHFVSIVGSCNGLVCISIGNTIQCLWNPSTRNWNRIPSNVLNKISFVMYNFGYDESTDDYKVVEICGIDYVASVYVYSLRNGHWKEIGAFPNCIPSFSSHGKFLNGALHWFATKSIWSSYPGTIVSLDLAKETYGEVLQPVYDEGDKEFTLGSLKEWLCVCCNHCGIHVDFWAMKVYGVKDSWTKLFSIPYETDVSWMSRYVEPLWIINDGNILLLLLSKLVVYDVKNSSLSEIQNVDGCLSTCTYVESLVSPGTRGRS